jgi:hypothetical protein
MYFKLNGKMIVKAMMENGRYIFNQVSKHHNEMAFPPIDYTKSDSNNQQSLMAGS